MHVQIPDIKSITQVKQQNQHKGCTVEPNLSVELSSEHRSALSTAGNMSYLLSAKYTVVDRFCASRSVRLLFCTKYVTSAICTPSSSSPLSSSLQRRSLRWRTTGQSIFQCLPGPETSFIEKATLWPTASPMFRVAAKTQARSESSLVQ